MTPLSYTERRGQIQTYFDRTAAQTWARLTSDRAGRPHPRQSVRAGRDRMRETADRLAARGPATALRVLDAGCGTGALAVEAAHRGAQVLAIDLSPTLVALARERQPAIRNGGSIDFRAGDMLASEWGRFDYVVGMDSVIHYETGRRGAGCSPDWHSAPGSACCSLSSPSNPALEVMRAVGKLFPRGDRSPAVVPVGPRRLQRRIAAEAAAARLARGPHRARLERVLHLAGHGAAAIMNPARTVLRLNASARQPVGPRRHPLPAVRRCRDLEGAAAGPPVAPVAVPGHGRHGDGAAGGHA